MIGNPDCLVNYNIFLPFQLVTWWRWGKIYSIEMLPILRNTGISKTNIFVLLCCISISAWKQSHTMVTLTLLFIITRHLLSILTVHSLENFACLVDLVFISLHLIVLITFIFTAWHCHLCPGTQVTELDAFFLLKYDIYFPLEIIYTTSF